MSDANDPSNIPAFMSGERWTMTDAGHIQKVFGMLDIPPLGGFRPVAITGKHTFGPTLDGVSQWL